MIGDKDIIENLLYFIEGWREDASRSMEKIKDPATSFKERVINYDLASIECATYQRHLKDLLVEIGLGVREYEE